MKNVLSLAVLLVIGQSISGAVVGHNGKSFTVTESDRSYRVGKESIDGTLRNVHASNMAAFLRRGRITAHKTSDGSYVLRGHVNGLGGGPMLASFAYWCTKSLCWGGVAAAGTAVVATGVGAGVALAGGAAAGGGAVATGGALAGATAKLGIGLGLKAVADTAVVGTAGIVGAGFTATATGTAIATTGTVATVTATAGTSLGFIGTIEALSLAAWAGAMALPTP